MPRLSGKISRIAALRALSLLGSGSGVNIASTQLTDSSNLARLDANQTFTNANQFNLTAAAPMRIAGDADNYDVVMAFQNLANNTTRMSIASNGRIAYDTGYRFDRDGLVTGTIQLLNGVVNLNGDSDAVRWPNSGLRLTRNAAGFLGVDDNSGGKAGIKLFGYTTTEKNAISSPSAGMVVYDLTLNKLCVYTGAAWQTVTSA